MKTVFFIITLIILIIWVVIGFIIWIPLLFRGTAIYSTSLAIAVTTNPDKEYMKNRNADFRKVIELYMDGFLTIFNLYRSFMNSTENSMTEKISGDEEENKNKKKYNKSYIFLFLLELVWTVFFWFSSLFLLTPNLFRAMSREIERIISYYMSFF